MKEIIMDCDPGHDDALAIMLALKCGKLKVHALTTVAGNTTIENATKNARFVLKLLGRQEIPIYSGAKKPLKRKLVRSSVQGKGGFEGLEVKEKPKLTGNAVEKILELVRKNPGRISLIATGPLTNIAKAIKKNPNAMKQLKEIFIMGGAVKMPGNISRVAEFNVFVDPEAADIVFRFPVKKTLVPIDACMPVRMLLQDFQKIRNKSLQKPIAAIMKAHIRNTFREHGINYAIMYDPLTVYALLNPSACKKKKYNILVETKGNITRGMTVADLRNKTKEKPNITVVERVEEKDFKRDFVKYLSRDQYGKFLHKIQQHKMKELWDNKEDESWNNR